MIEEWMDRLGLREIVDAFTYLGEPLYLGLVALLVLLLLVFIVLIRHQPATFIAEDRGNGQVLIARDAIRKMVQRTCASIAAIAKAQVRVRTRGKQLKIESRLKLKTGTPIAPATKLLQEVLDRQLDENVGRKNVGQIDIVVTGFSGKAPIETITALPAPSEGQAAAGPEAQAVASEPPPETPASSETISDATTASDHAESGHREIYDTDDSEPRERSRDA